MGEQLTDAEREAIGERVCFHCNDRDVWSLVERIKADAYAAGAAAGRAEMREKAAEAIRLALLPDTAERLISLIGGDQ